MVPHSCGFIIGMIFKKFIFSSHANLPTLGFLINVHVHTYVYSFRQILLSYTSLLESYTFIRIWGKILTFLNKFERFLIFCANIFRVLTFWILDVFCNWKYQLECVYTSFQLTNSVNIWRPLRLLKPYMFIDMLKMCLPIRLLEGVRLLGTLE